MQRALATALVTVIVSLATNVAAAQQLTRSAAEQAAANHDRVWVLVEGSDRALRGRLIHIGAETVAIEVETHDKDGLPARRTIDVPTSRVRRIDVEKRDSFVEGALVGALFFAACAKWWCGQGMSGPPPNPWLAAGLGALLGGALDAALYDRARIFNTTGLARARSRTRFGVAFRIRF